MQTGTTSPTSSGRLGLKKVEVQAIDVPTVFRNFDDYWSPFLEGTPRRPRDVAE